MALLAVQIIIGYEWLSSGITKVASGNFVSGLGPDLKEKSHGAPHWYRSFLSSSIIPNARTFGALIEVGEIIVGVVFILAAIIWLARWSRLSDRWRMTILSATMLAAVGATLMAINFHLANGGNHPWLIPAAGFNETVDVDAVLSAIQAAFFIFSGYVVVGIRRAHSAASNASVSASGVPASPIPPPH